LVVREGGITFGLQSAHHIDNRDETDLAHPFDSHDPLSVHLPFLMGSAEARLAEVEASRYAADSDGSDPLV